MTTTSVCKPMPVERSITVLVNDSVLLCAQTTPICLADWAVGLLAGQGIITAPEDLHRLCVDEEQGLIHAKVLRRPPPFSRAEPRPVHHRLQVTQTDLWVWMQRMQSQTPLYDETGGMHASAAVHVPSGDMLVREDVSRHTALDKAIGAALRAGWPTSQLVVLTSGRISGETSMKLARLGVGIAASRTAITDHACRAALPLAVDLVGYLRGVRQMRIYTSGDRIQG